MEWENYCRTDTNPELKGNLWAPDVIYNEKMGKYCMYMSVNGVDWNSVIVMLTADSIEGPYAYGGPVVYSGFDAGDKHPAEEIIRSLQIRKEGVSHPREIIPIRVLEIGEVNTAFEWASTTIKKQLTKDFTASESDIDSIQQVMDSGRFQTQQRMAWENFGIAFGAILVNEMEGMEWVTVIEGQKEYPALQFMCSDMVLDPAALVWGKAKKGLPCDLKSEFRKIKREAEAVLDDLNK